MARAFALSLLFVACSPATFLAQESRDSQRALLRLLEEGDDASACRRLLERGLDPSLPLGDGTTPLVAAAERGRLGVVGVLVELVDVNARCERRGETALFAAASAGEQETVDVGDLTLEPGGELRGRVSWSDDAPAAGALLQLRREDGRTLAAVTDDQLCHTMDTRGA